jgi:hypothetical protein
MEGIGCCEKRMLMKTFVLIYALCAVATFLAEMVLFLFRKKYAVSLSKQDVVKKERVLQSSRTVVKMLRILFWLSPIYVVIVPLIVYWGIGWDWFIYMEIVMISMYLPSLPLFFTRKWIIQCFEK